MDGNPRAAFLLIVAWAHAARGSNMLNLRRSDFTQEGRCLKWAKAKTTATRGVYTTHSQYGAFSTFVNEFLNNAPPSGYLLQPSDLDTVRKELKSFDKRYNLRSLRRGALQQLALTGLPAEKLREFSGHTTDKSLLRYLNFGEKYHVQRQVNVDAAATLWLTPSAAPEATA